MNDQSHRRFSWIFYLGHCLGLTQCLAVFLRARYGVSYREFYSRLLFFAEENPSSVIGKQLLAAHSEEQAFVNVIAEKRKFYDEVNFWLLEATSEPRVIEDIVRYQEAVVITPGIKEQLLSLNFNVPEFLGAAYNGKKAEFKRHPIVYQVKPKKFFASVEEISCELDRVDLFLQLDLQFVAEDRNVYSRSWPFPRGRGPLVSVLLATRKRVRFLYGAVDSLLGMATDADQVEILFKVDEDDQETRDFLPKLCQLASMSFQVLISPRGNGYKDMHLWMNSLCGMAKGDWILVFNDDARMVTPAWDLGLLACNSGYDDSIYLFIAHVPGRPGSQEFFFVRRKVFEVLGYLAPVPHLDTWLCGIMTMIQRACYCSIKIEHFNDCLSDETAIERKRACASTVFDLDSPKMIRAKIADALKLMDYIENFGKER